MAAEAPSGGAFRSLRSYNYRVWAGGALVSNVGAWMQRIAQDWLVLTQLTHNNATAMGVVMGLQFGPQVLLLPQSHFPFLRMDIDIHKVARHLKMEDKDRMSASAKHGPIAVANGKINKR